MGSYNPGGGPASGTDTLQTVTNRGATTTNGMTINTSGGGTEVLIATSDTAGVDIDLKPNSGTNTHWHWSVADAVGTMKVFDEKGTGDKTRLTFFQEDVGNTFARIQVGKGGVPILLAIDTASTAEVSAIAAATFGDLVFDFNVSRMLTHNGTSFVRAGGADLDDITDNTTFATEQLTFDDAGSVSATEQDWIEVTVDGNTDFIRVFAAK